jgi:20S proteasome alpha/beta subunit
MTLIIAAQGDGFIVAAADTRETVDAGAIRVEVNIAEKLVMLTPHTAVLFCGDSGYAQNIIARYQAKIAGQRELGVTPLADDFAIFCQEEAKKTVGVPTFSRVKPYRNFPDIGFVLGGLDKAGRKFTQPRCYGLSSWTGYRLELGGGGFVLDGKPMLARYLFAHHYRAGMDIGSLCDLVIRCLYDTSRVDGDVGGKYRLAIILPDEVRLKHELEIEEMINDADLRW